MSPLGKKHDPNSAVDFAAFYIKALDWSYATTDPYLLKQVSAPSCKACKIVIDGLTGLRAEGGHVKGDRIRIESAELCLCTDTQVKADQIVKIVDTQDAGGIVHADGTVENKHGRHRVTTYVYLSWAGQGWTVVGEFK